MSRVKENLKAEINQTHTIIKQDFNECKNLYTVRSYLDSILHNLISNSIKYRHPDRSPIITVKASSQDKSVVLEVSDNGIGFNVEENKAKLFHLYGRFHNHVEGRGIGLFLVKTQVLALNGKISVESQPDEGTTFTLVFGSRE